MDLKKRHEAILAREHARARQIAFEVIKSKPLSVWEVLIPIVFIMGYMKSKQEREIFAQNLLFTRKTALKAARDIHRRRLTRHEVRAEIEEQTGRLLTAVADGVYSEDIRHSQHVEMELLLDHYLLLLEAAGGEDYDGWVRAAYGSRANYDRFLSELAAAEKKVNQAARRTLGERADTSVLARIETATESLRAAETDKIFGP